MLAGVSTHPFATGLECYATTQRESLLCKAPPLLAATSPVHERLSNNRALRRDLACHQCQTPLSGTLPQELGALTSLQALCALAMAESPLNMRRAAADAGSACRNLTNNTALEGTLPEEWASLSSLLQLCAS